MTLVQFLVLQFLDDVAEVLVELQNHHTRASTGRQSLDQRFIAERLVQHNVGAERLSCL